MVHLDALLMAPFRLGSDVMAGFVAGSMLWALAGALLGRLLGGAALALQRKHVSAAERDAARYSQASLRALRAGDRTAYRRINRLANDAFGRSLGFRFGMAAPVLLPAFLLAGWLQTHFAAVSFPLPGTGVRLGCLAPFVLAYVGWSLLLSTARGRHTRE